MKFIRFIFQAWVYSLVGNTHLLYKNQSININAHRSPNNLSKTKHSWYLKPGFVSWQKPPFLISLYLGVIGFEHFPIHCALSHCHNPMYCHGNLMKSSLRVPKIYLAVEVVREILESFDNKVEKEKACPPRWFNQGSPELATHYPCMPSASRAFATRPLSNKMVDF